MKSIELVTTKKIVDISIGSDFHIEDYVCDKFFNPIDFIPKIATNSNNFNICLLAGDICVLKKKFRNKLFMAEFCKLFDLVVYIEGNHENHGGNLNHNFKKFEKLCEDIKNLCFLQRETLTLKINSLTFKIVAATLWGDIRNADPTTLYYASLLPKYAPPDHFFISDLSSIRVEIKGTYPRLSPFLYMAANKRDTSFILEEADHLRDDDINILMTHHSPIPDPANRTDGYGVFEFSDLTKTLAGGKFDIAVFGHIHRDLRDLSNFHVYSKQVGNCTCFSNPAGNHELNVEKSKYMITPIKSYELQQVSI